MTGVDAFVDNATAMWTAVAADVSVDRALFRAETPRMTRLILQALASADDVSNLLESLPSTKAAVLEDAFGAGRVKPSDPAVRVFDLPVMLRPAGTAQAVSDNVAQVERISDPDELAIAERTIVESFPLSALQPWRRGEALPAHVLAIPGWSVWLAYLQDRPVAAGYTFDDGRVVGVYWLVTSPGYRSSGLGRAVMTRAIEAHPDRPLMLAATDAGRPLYESMGFQTVATATWYMRSADGSRGAASIRA